MLAMDAPASTTAPAIEAAKVALLQAITPLQPEDIVRGQYRGYRREAVSLGFTRRNVCRRTLAIDNARWRGVPFGIRAGKCLAETMTDVRVRFRRRPRALRFAEIEDIQTKSASS